MPVDSRDKRASAIAVALSWNRTAPVPDGDISGVADRIHIAGAYRGVLPQAEPGPPILVGASISGNVLYLNFDTAVTFGAGGNAGIALTLSGGAITASYSSGDGSAQLLYGLSRTPAPTETGTLAYTQPGDGIESVVGGLDLATIASQSVEVGGGGRVDFRLNNVFYVRF